MEEGLLDVEGRLVGGGYVRCGRGKYEEVEGRLVEEGLLDVEGRLVGGGYVRYGRGKYEEV